MREKPTIRSSTKQKISIQDLVRPAPVSYIVPNLYLGDKYAAADRSELQKLKITHIVNCARDLPDRFAPSLDSSSSPLRSRSPSPTRAAAAATTTTTPTSCSSSSSLHLSSEMQQHHSDEEMHDADDLFHSGVGAGEEDDEWGPTAYHRCELVDSSRSELALEEALVQVFAFIDAAMASSSSGNGAVLIHCCAGRSRAPAVMTAYLMYRYRWSLEKAYSLVCQARPAVCPNRGFLQVLLRLEKRLLGANTMRLRNNGHHHTLVSLESRPKKLAVC